VAESSFDQLQSQIKKGKIASLYLFHGPEEWLKEKIVVQIKTALFPTGEGELNTNTFDAAEADGAEIAASAQTAPFLAERRLVLVKNADQMPAAQARVLGEGLDDLLPSTCVILLYKGKADRKDPLAARVPENQLFTFWTPFPSQLPAWIIAEASRQGKKISRDAAGALAELIPASLQDLSMEIEKLALHADKGATITRADVEELTDAAETSTPWELESSLQQKDLAGVFRKLNTILGQGKPTEMLLGGIERTLRNFLLAKCLEEAGTPAEELPKYFGIRGRTREDDFKRGLRRYKRGELENALLRLERCEWDIKTGALSGEIALKMFLVKLLRQGVN
jgi:DNA polymerase-3 subunit delta